MGIFALCITVLNIFSIIGRAGLDMGLLRFVAEYTSQGKWNTLKRLYIKSMKIAILLCLSLTVFLQFFSPFLAEYIFHKDYLYTYFRIISFAILPMVLLLINSECLRGLKKIKEFIFLQDVSIFLCASIILIMLLPFTKAISVPVIAYVTGLAIVAVFSMFIWFKKSGLLKLTSKEGRVKTKDILTVSLPMMLSSSLYFIMHWTDTIMLGIMRTENDVGVYNVALKVAMLASFTLFAINSIAAPKFAESYGKRDKEGLKQVVRHSSKLIFWTSLPILVILLLFPSFILGIFGEEFKVGVFALIMLTLGQFINAISGSVGYLLIMTGKQRVHQHIVLVATILNIILNAVLIPEFGINGAAFASMFAIIFRNLSSAIYIKYSMNIMTLYIPFIVRR